MHRVDHTDPAHIYGLISFGRGSESHRVDHRHRVDHTDPGQVYMACTAPLTAVPIAPWYRACTHCARTPAANL